MTIINKAKRFHLEYRVDSNPETTSYPDIPVGAKILWSDGGTEKSYVKTHQGAKPHYEIGLQGDTGVQGDTGIQGIQGITGLDGTLGAKGETGVQGETGWGIQGETGIQGTIGATGDVGPQGETGIQGATGVGAGGGGVSTYLDNLTPPTAINADLLPENNITHSLGAPSIQWLSVYSGNMYATNMSSLSGSNLNLRCGGTSYLRFDVDDNIYSYKDIIPTSILDLGSVSNPWRNIYTESIEHPDNATLQLKVNGSNRVSIDGLSLTSWGNVLPATAGKSLGAANSFSLWDTIHVSNISNNVDTIAVSELTELTDGSVTSLHSHAGGGVSGGATTELDNLTTTSINADLIPDSSGTRSLGTYDTRWLDVYTARVNPGNTGILELFNSSGNTIALWPDRTEFSMDLFPSIDSTYDFGSSTNYWDNIYANYIHANFVDGIGGLYLRADGGNRLSIFSTSAISSVNFIPTPTNSLNLGDALNIWNNLYVNNIKSASDTVTFAQLKELTDGSVTSLHSHPTPSGSGLIDPMLDRGDIIIRDDTNTTNRLQVGVAGHVLTSDGTDVIWAPSSGGVTVVNDGDPIPFFAGGINGDVILEGSAILNSDIIINGNLVFKDVAMGLVGNHNLTVKGNIFSNVGSGNIIDLSAVIGGSSGGTITVYGTVYNTGIVSNGSDTGNGGFAYLGSFQGNDNIQLDGGSVGDTSTAGNGGNIFIYGECVADQINYRGGGGIDCTCGHGGTLVCYGPLTVDRIQATGGGDGGLGTCGNGGNATLYGYAVARTTAAFNGGDAFSGLGIDGQGGSVDVRAGCNFGSLFLNPGESSGGAGSLQDSYLRGDCIIGTLTTSIATPDAVKIRSELNRDTTLTIGTWNTISTKYLYWGAGPTGVEVPTIDNRIYRSPKGGAWYPITRSGERTTIVATTPSIADGYDQVMNLAAFKGYNILKVETSAACWLRIYDSSDARTADAGRSEGTDPLFGSGVIAEVISTGAQIFYIAPAIAGYSRTDEIDMFVSIKNKSGITQAITVNITVHPLEF